MQDAESRTSKDIKGHQAERLGTPNPRRSAHTRGTHGALRAVFPSRFSAQHASMGHLDLHQLRPTTWPVSQLQVPVSAAEKRGGGGGGGWE